MTITGLLKFVQQEEVAYQLVDGLLSFSNIDRAQIIESLQGAASLSLVNRDEMMEGAYSELANWSIDSDSLFLTNNGALVCLSKSLMESYRETA